VSGPRERPGPRRSTAPGPRPPRAAPRRTPAPGPPGGRPFRGAVLPAGPGLAGQLVPTDRFARGLDLDPGCAAGRGALLYTARGGGGAGAAAEVPGPAVWFQDRALVWHFVASSFEDYYRLLCMHLGIEGWLGAFTPWGMDPSARQWLRFLSPERTAIDADARGLRFGQVGVSAEG